MKPKFEITQTTTDIEIHVEAINDRVEISFDPLPENLKLIHMTDKEAFECAASIHSVAIYARNLRLKKRK